MRTRKPCSGPPRDSNRRQQARRATKLLEPSPLPGPKVPTHRRLGKGRLIKQPQLLEPARRKALRQLEARQVRTKVRLPKE